MNKKLRYFLATITCLFWLLIAIGCIGLFIYSVTTKLLEWPMLLILGLLSLVFVGFFIGAVYFNFFDKDNEYLGMDPEEDMYEGATWGGMILTFICKACGVFAAVWMCNLCGKDISLIKSIFISLVGALLICGYDYIWHIIKTRKKNNNQN